MAQVVSHGGHRSFVFTDFMSAEETVAAGDSIEREVRKSLGIAFNPSRAATHDEHSMGQRSLPDYVLRSSDASLRAASSR